MFLSHHVVFTRSVTIQHVLILHSEPSRDCCNFVCADLPFEALLHFNVDLHDCRKSEKDYATPLLFELFSYLSNLE